MYYVRCIWEWWRSRDTELLSWLTSLGSPVFSSHVTHMHSLVRQVTVDPINEVRSHQATGGIVSLGYMRGTEIADETESW